MADHQENEKWFEGKSSLFKSRAERVKADIARRKAGRKAIKLRMSKSNGRRRTVCGWDRWSPKSSVSRTASSKSTAIYPPHSHSVTHKHNEAIIIVLRGTGYSILDDERIDWKPGDTLYVGQGVWHEHHVTGDEPAMVFAINPLPIQEYLGELNNLRFVKHRVLDSICKQFGDKGLESKLVDKLLLYTTRDPLTYARGLAFHTKLGLFNPVQLLLQGQTYFHMAAIAGPKIALQAGPAALFMRGLRFTDDEKIIGQFAEWATKYGWKKDDFIEAYNELRQTGWDRVGKEVAQLDDALEPQIVKTNMGKFMDWSATFFNEGERFVRVSSYNAAYLEWRTANPLAKLTAKARAQILDRADLFGGNGLPEAGSKVHPADDRAADP